MVPLPYLYGVLKDAYPEAELVFVAPLLQTLIFVYSAVIESKNIPIAVIDRDFSATSREFRQTLENCGYFILIDDNLKESDIDRYFKLGKITI